MSHYPLWKYVVLLVALVIGGVYALPNLYGEDPALQVATPDGEVPAESVRQDLVRFLEDEGVTVTVHEILDDTFVLRFASTDDQIRAADLAAAHLGRDYTVAMMLAPATPRWLRNLGAEPMFLGLDLRGGVHFLLEVDIDEVQGTAMERNLSDFRTALRDERLRHTRLSLEDDSVIHATFERAEERDQAVSVLSRRFEDLTFETEEIDGEPGFRAFLSEEELREIRDFAIQQNITTIRARVDELGIAEPVVQRQGAHRIIVQLPGIQDPARAKEILGATATLEFRLVDERYFPFTGDPDDPPPGTEVFEQRRGGHVALQREVILTGDRIVDAASGFDAETGSPEVNIRLSGAGGRLMNRATRDEVGNHMAVLFIERVTETEMVDGEPQRVSREVREVISVAQIREALGSRFRITGLQSSQEARNLALLLRAGALAAPIDIVEERTIGPSLGQQNVEQGFLAVVLGFVLVVVFMAVYYRVFGLIANLALLTNLVLIVAVLSMLQATLTLPGIAGIVLTVGMAVDANVLIFQRIREELAAGVKPQTAIDNGYGKALSTILDANITTIIAAAVLFIFGSGPVQGFAVTLSIGLLTSMFTAIVGTRAIVHLIYGGQQRVTEVKI